MSEHWEDVTLEQVATDVTVGHVGPMADQYVEAGIPFLRSLNVEPFNINTNDLKQISNEFHLKLKKSALKPGDIVIVRTGKPGSCAVIPEWLPEANCSDVVVVRANSKVRPSFISFVVNSSAAHHINAHTVGAVQQHFNVGSARQIRFRLPPIAEQDRILGVLGALNDKIELNRRMNETLEATARAIFQDWFVDFGPTRAKMQGRAPYLGADTWSLFPDAFDETGKPEGWTKRPLSDFFDIIGGGTPKTSVDEYWNGDIPWFSVVDTPSDGSGFVYETEKSITRRGVEESSVRLVPSGTTIISARGTIGNLAIAAREMAFNQSCYALKGKGHISDWIVYLTAQHMITQLKSFAHGSVFSTITRQTFDAVSLVMADKVAIRRFEEFIRPFFERQRANSAESRTLRATRDFLIPKLISGEIRVGDAENHVRDAT